MADQQVSSESVEDTEPDSDSTDATESMILSEGEEEEGSRTPSIHEEETENEILESPEIRRRSRRHQILSSDDHNEDNPGSAGAGEEATSSQQNNEEAPMLRHLTVSLPRLELQALQELEHPPSASEPLVRESLITVERPSSSQQQQQQQQLPTQPPIEEGDVSAGDSTDTGISVITTHNIPSESHNRLSSEAGPSTSTLPPESPTPSVQSEASTDHPEDAGLTLATTVNIPSEDLNRPLSESGPSTSTLPPDGTSENQPTGKATAQINADCEDEGQLCSICFEPWSNMGDHHLACLKCGHLFGYGCIIKWLEGPYGQKGRCPQCNAKASKKDVRKLYAKNIVVVDTTEKERFLKDLEKEKKERRKLEVKYANSKIKNELQNQQLSKVLKELEVLKASVGKAAIRGGESSNSRGNCKERLVFKEFLEVCRKGDCRVMAYNEWMAMLVVSMPSQVEMFPGFGIKKINMLELRVHCYVPLHQQQIRDLAFNPARHDMLLSVAIDRYVKVTNIQSNATMGQFIAPGPVWCCCWSTKDANVFYVGTVNGHLIQYDTRQTSCPVGLIDLPGRGPVVSLAYIHPGPESTLTTQGVVVARLQQCFFVEEWLAKTHTLHTEGNVASVSSVANSTHVLVSFRPSPQFPHARHVVCTLHQREGSNGDDEVSINPLHNFQGGTTNKVLTRSLLTRSSQNRSSLLVYTGDEATQNVFVWDVATLTCLQQLHCSDTVVDVQQLRVNETVYLAALTTKGVRLYQWTTQS